MGGPAGFAQSWATGSAKWTPRRNARNAPRSPWLPRIGKSNPFSVPSQGPHLRGVRVQRIAFDNDLAGQNRTLHCDIKMRRNDVFALSRHMVASLTACPGILRVKWG